MKEDDKSKVRFDAVVNNLQLTQVKDNPEVINGLMKYINNFFYGGEDKIISGEDNDDIIDEGEEDQALFNILIKHKVRSIAMEQFVENYNLEKEKTLASLTESSEYNNSSTLDKESLKRGLLDTFNKKIEQDITFSRQFLHYVSTSTPPLEIMTDKKMNDLHTLYSKISSDLLELLYNFFTYQYHSIPISVARVYDGTDYYPIALKYCKKGILKQGVIENYADALKLLKKPELIKISKEIEVKVKTSLKADDIIKLIVDHPKIPEVFFNYRPQKEIFILPESNELNKNKMLEIIKFETYFSKIVEEIKLILQNN
jgi:hypothetical protein